MSDSRAATVLHVIDRADAGGAQQVLLDIATGIDRANWRSIVAVAGPGWLASRLSEANLPTRFTPIKRGSFDWQYIRQLLRIVRRDRVELIHAHLFGPSIYAGLVGILTRTPVVATLHGQVDIAPNERFRAAKYRIVGSACSRVVFVSSALEQYTRDTRGFAPPRTAVIHNGIDLAAFQRPSQPDAGRSLDVPPGKVIVGAIGNIRAPKDYPTLIRAAAELAPLGRYYFVVAGAPDESDLAEHLLSMIQELGLADSFRFIGFVEDVGSFLLELDVYVISSSLEGMSLSTVQAMAMGVPVVATRSGGPTEIVEHERSGLLVDVGDARGIAASVQRIATDPQLADRLAAEGKKSVAARFQKRRMLDAYEDVYREAIAAR